MGLHEDLCLVNEANGFAVTRSDWPWFPSRKLAAMLSHVCAAYYRLRESRRGDEDATDRARRIALEQTLAGILAKHCEDKSSPPYLMVDGAFDIGVKSPLRLAEEVEARIDEIVRFRDVMARKHLEDRDEYEQKLGRARSHIEELEKSRREIRDELTESTEAIRVKDAALLAAAERISGQAEAMTAAAARGNCGPCDTKILCTSCSKPICPVHNKRSKNNTGRCQRCEDDIPF